MKTTLKLMLLAAIVAMVAGPSLRVSAQTPSADAGKWVGTWEGKEYGVPSVILKITKNGDALQGQADFYILIRNDSGVPTNAGKMTAPMIHPHVQGNDLDFQVVREDRNVSAAEKTVLNFTMEPTGDRAAKLNRTGDEPLEVEMVRVE